jgi:dihydrodipicolinate synthase/N-acetylneuraminate lyase
VTLGGLIVPTPTLFGEKGELDPERNARFTRGLVEAGVDHIFTLGSLGEFPSIATDERPGLLAAVVGAVSGRTDVWVGCGAPSTLEAVRRAREAESAGAAALVAVPPYYLHPTEGSIGRYYRELHRATRLPLLAYNIPSLVGYALRPGFLHALGAEGVIQGVKDTNGSQASVLEHLRGAPPGYVVIPGDDELATDSILAGSAGAVMGTANVLPRTAVGLVRAALSRDTAEAREHQAVIDRLVHVLRAGPFPSTGKYLARRLRGADDGYRSPYDPLTSDEEARVLAALAPHDAEFRRRG